ncbi:AMP-binding protein [Streptomyces cinnamoneus]|uniref:AMP-binding protein n=1 Tax=Streptomyces cinnamoneus TaxID=53446 RepID=UPI00378EB5C6
MTLVHEMPCRLRDIVDAMPAKPGSALFHRRDGAMTRVPYPECHRDALAVARRLRARGVRPGDRVAVHGTTSYAWVLADLGCLLAGAVSVALYPSAPAPRVVAAARESDCRLVLTERQEFTEAFGRAGVDALPLDAVGAAGTSGPGPGPGASCLPKGPSSGPFTIVSTSGTLSEPKLFAVHSAPLLYTMDRFAELYDIGGQDRILLYLPLSHLPQRMMLYWGLGAGMDFVLSDPAHMARDGRELSPTLHVAVPRSLEHLRWRAENLRDRGEAADLGQAYAAVFGKAVKAVFVGSAPTPPALLEALHEAGPPVYEVYGTTELGMVGLNVPGATRAGTVGRPIPWGEVRLDEGTGEILVRTPTPFLYGRLAGGEVVPESLRDTWQPTGDVGSVDEDGYLSVRGRLREFLALSNGEKVFVRPIEEAAAEATGAAECVVLTTDSRRLQALLFFEFGAPGDREDCRRALGRLKRTLHSWERVQRFALVDRLPSVEEGSLTETLKIRRHKVEETYGRDAAWHPVHRDREGN